MYNISIHNIQHIQIVAYVAAYHMHRVVEVHLDCMHQVVQPINQQRYKRHILVYCYTQNINFDVLH